MKYSIYIILLLGILAIGCQDDSKIPPRELTPTELSRAQLIEDSLAYLHSMLNPPQEGDWLSSHPEKGETFSQYIRKWPKTASEQQSKFYLVKLSSFNTTQQIIFNKTYQYISLFYDTQVDTFTLDIDYTAIPEKFYRKNDLEEIQVLTDFFLKQKLLEALPDDAWGMIGCTAVDIFPDPKWNFVYGQASLKNRVGVWSMRRLGDPEAYPETEDKAFMRNLKVATHETGHILSMKHCIYYDCLMNGSAHLLENDSKPPYLCPVCLGKADWNRGFNIQNRFDTLHWFWNKNQYSIYHQYYEIVKEIEVN